MTKKEAKELTLEVWKELAADGTIEEKYQLPTGLYKKIENLDNECPLCELFNRREEDHWPSNCSGCPLKESNQQCYSKGDFYSEWDKESTSPEARKEMAQGIVDIVENWVTD